MVYPDWKTPAGTRERLAEVQATWLALSAEHTRLKVAAAAILDLYNRVGNELCDLEAAFPAQES